MPKRRPEQKTDPNIEYIKSLPVFAPRPGLEAMRELLRRVGSPHERLKAIHVAGTNGKGTTCAFIEAALRAAGYKTGLYVSPSVASYYERIQLRGQNVSPAQFAEKLALVRAAIEAMRAEGLQQITAFEAETAVAMLIFAEECDICVLEVGLGGRFDATNVIPPPYAAVITSISLDHTAVLGGTVEKIAAEKAGIIKAGSRAVAAPGQPQEALSVIKAVSAEKRVPLCAPSELPEQVELSLGGTSFVYSGRSYRTKLIGRHFAANAAAAIEALRLMGGTPFQVSEDEIAAGIAEASMPCRMELVCSEPAVILDGAHNQDAADRLCENIAALPKRRLILVLGMLSDKNCAYCVPKLAALADVLIATEPPSPRALPAVDTALTAQRAANPPKTIGIQRRPERALLTALRFTSSPQDLVLCCGSFSFLGSLRGEMKKLKEQNAKYNIF